MEQRVQLADQLARPRFMMSVVTSFAWGRNYGHGDERLSPRAKRGDEKGAGTHGSSTISAATREETRVLESWVTAVQFAGTRSPSRGEQDWLYASLPLFPSKRGPPGESVLPDLHGLASRCPRPALCLRRSRGASSRASDRRLMNSQKGEPSGSAVAVDRRLALLFLFVGNGREAEVVVESKHCRSSSTSCVVIQTTSSSATCEPMLGHLPTALSNYKAGGPSMSTRTRPVF